MIKEITVHELNQLITQKASFQLIDVREPHEIEIATIGGLNIPLGSVPDNLDKVDTDKQVIIYCRSGKRSGNAVNYIQSNTAIEEIYNLKGGILEWADEIDDSLTKY